MLLKLPKPFFVLAPMDDVTDTVFRRIVAECAPPDLFFTEFASVDGFQSPGRAAVEKKLKFHPEERPLVAQLWGTNPDNFRKTAAELTDHGYAGLDLNMGCPVKNVVKLGACSALMQNRDLAHEIILAIQDGAGDLPISIKTRIGQAGYDEGWIRFLLEHRPVMLTVHWRSVKELSSVDAHWDLAPAVVKLRDEISPETKLIGNGDILSRAQGQALAEQYNLDGIMIGRGIFHDPYIFSDNSPWTGMTRAGRIALYKHHVMLFQEEWGQAKNPAVLKKFAKVYISGFDGAKELRERLVTAKNSAELLATLDD